MSESESPRISQTEEAGDEVEAHGHRIDQNAEPTDEGDDEVEAHGRFDAPKLDAPKLD
jgi:hypothetical protein